MPLASHMSCIEFLIPDQKNTSLATCTFDSSPNLVGAYFSADIFVHGLRRHDSHTFISYSFLYWQFLPLIPVRTWGLTAEIIDLSSIDDDFVECCQCDFFDYLLTKMVLGAEIGCGRDY